jgi:HEAT repeat protein
MTALVDITALLDDADPESRRRGAQLVGHVAGAPAVQLLVRALGDTDWRVRKEAAAMAPGVEPRSSSACSPP